MLGAEITAAAQSSGCAFHATRGAIDVSLAAGGGPPRGLVEDTDAVLESMEAAVLKFHDPSPGSDGAYRACAMLAHHQHRASHGRVGDARAAAGGHSAYARGGGHRGGGVLRGRFMASDR